MDKAVMVAVRAEKAAERSLDEYCHEVWVEQAVEPAVRDEIIKELGIV
jgi:hypothetical protein